MPSNTKPLKALDSGIAGFLGFLETVCTVIGVFFLKRSDDGTI